MDKRLRRSRAIKVKPDRKSALCEEGQPKVLDRIQAYDKLVKQSKDAEQPQVPVFGGHQRGGRQVLESKENKSRTLDTDRVDNVVGQSQGIVKAKTLGEPVANYSHSDQQAQVGETKHGNKLNIHADENIRIRPPLSPKPKPKEQRTYNSDMPKSLISELTLKLQGDTSDFPPDTNSPSERCSVQRPPISPKPKLLAKGHSDKNVKPLTESNTKDVLLRSKSNPDKSQSAKESSFPKWKTKDSGYGSSPNVLGNPKGDHDLERVKTSGLCQSIDNLDQSECIIEDISQDDLTGYFQVPTKDTNDGKHAQGDEDSAKAARRTGMNDQPVYLTCVEGENSDSEEGAFYQNTNDSEAVDRTENREGNRNSLVTDSTIYNSVHPIEDQDFSDWSDFDDSDEFDDFTDTEDDLDASDDEVDSELLAELRKDKYYCIVEELKDTEVNYVTKLKLLAEAKACAEETIKQDTKIWFPYIEEIYRLHSEDFLPKLKSRVKSWKEHRCIGDIVKRFAPFLKIYTDYVKNYEKLDSTVKTLLEKSAPFKKDMQKICEKYAKSHGWVKLDITAHMLEPVQRVPRYQLLLRDYLKRLPDDADPVEIQNVEDALNGVTVAAAHFEDTINQKSDFIKLVSLEETIESPIPLANNDRKLVKEGPLQKYCLRNDKLETRQLFLFSDILLVCKEYSLKIAGPKLKVRQVLHIQDMEVLDGSKLDHKLSFMVKTKEKIMEFVADTEKEKQEWQKELWKVIQGYTNGPSRTNSVKSEKSDTMDVPTEEPRHQALGQVAPQWVKNMEVTMCMVCTSNFSTFLRRHHCRACGSVVCSKCSSHVWKLAYARSEQRVCDNCYMRLQDEGQTGMKNTYTIRAASRIKKRFRDLCIQWGYVQLSENGGRSWQRMYCEIHEGGLLFVYKASQNPKPEWNADLGGAEVSTEYLSGTPALKVSLCDGKTCHVRGVFKEQSSEELLRWGKAFDKAIKDGGFRHSKQFPDDEDNSLPTTDNSSGNDRVKGDCDTQGSYDAVVSQRPLDPLSENNSDNSEDEENIYEPVNVRFPHNDPAIYDDVPMDSDSASEEGIEIIESFDGKICISESNC